MRCLASKLLRSSSSMMLMLTLLLLLVVVAPALGARRLADGSVSYRAASTVHIPVNIQYGVTPRYMITTNLAHYTKLIEKAAEERADVILFPESGTGFFQVPFNYTHLFCEPVPAIGWRAPESECAALPAVLDNATMPHAVWASCAAREHRMAVVINYCNTTAANATKKHYNSDVIFDETGHLIAMHAKSFITGTGPYLSQPPLPDRTVFTLFNTVNFTVVTCYEFWFPSAYDFGGERRAGNVLFNSEMMAAQPYYTLLGVAAGLSLAHGVNVINSVSRGNGVAGACLRDGTIGLNVIDSFPPLALSPPFSKVVVNDIVDGGAKIWAPLPKQQEAEAQPRRRAEERALSAALSAPMACYYGPAEFPRLHFPMGCRALRVSSLKTGQTYALRSSITAPGMSVNCSATFTADRNMASPLSNATWLLAAISVAVTPTIDTPSSTVNGGCVLLRCVDPAGGCMKGDLLSGWSSDLGVSAVSVSVAVSGDNITAGPCPDGSGPSCAPLFYPYVSVTNLVSDSAAPPTNASFIGYKNRPIAGSVWSQKYNAQGRVWSGTVSNNNKQALGADLFAAAGIWVTAYWGSIY